MDKELCSRSVLFPAFFPESGRSAALCRDKFIDKIVQIMVTDLFHDFIVLHVRMKEKGGGHFDSVIIQHLFMEYLFVHLFVRASVFEVASVLTSVFMAASVFILTFFCFFCFFFYSVFFTMYSPFVYSLFGPTLIQTIYP